MLLRFKNIVKNTFVFIFGGAISLLLVIFLAIFLRRKKHKKTQKKGD